MSSPACHVSSQHAVMIRILVHISSNMHSQQGLFPEMAWFARLLQDEGIQVESAWRCPEHQLGDTDNRQSAIRFACAQALVCSPSDLVLGDGGQLCIGETQVDFIYNRLTDFCLRSAPLVQARPTILLCGHPCLGHLLVLHCHFFLPAGIHSTATYAWLCLQGLLG